MAFKKGHVKAGGRKPGTPNKKDTMQERLEQIVTKDGTPIDIVRLFFQGLMDLAPFQRTEYLLKLFEFVYPKQRQLEVGNSNGDGFKVIIEDYSKK